MKKIFNNFDRDLMTKNLFSASSLFSIACVTLLSLSLGLNLVNFYWIDFIFILATLLGLFRLGSGPSVGFRTKFGLTNSPFVLFFALFFYLGSLVTFYTAPCNKESGQKF